MTPSEPEYIEVPMRCGRKFRVDKESFGSIQSFSWSLHKQKGGHCYVVRYVYEKSDGISPRRHRRVSLSRSLMGLGVGDPRVVDHKDGDTLNNCISNLRVCTVAENSRNQRMRCCNKSGFKGVAKSVRKSGSIGWIGYIMVMRKRHNLGIYSTPEEAHEAYCKAAEILHGEFANFGEDLSRRGDGSVNQNFWARYVLGLRLRALERRLVELGRKQRITEDQIFAVRKELEAEGAGGRTVCLDLSQRHR